MIHGRSKQNQVGEWLCRIEGDASLVRFRNEHKALETGNWLGSVRILHHLVGHLPYQILNGVPDRLEKDQIGGSRTIELKCWV